MQLEECIYLKKEVKNMTRKNREYNKIEIIKAMEQNPMFIDNHDNKEKDLIGLAEFVSESRELACCIEARYFSLNQCYMDDDRLHCSMMSIGGVLWGIGVHHVDEYNESVVFEGMKIRCIHLPDGTKVYPTVRV